MAAVGSPVIPFIPFRGNPKLVDGPKRVDGVVPQQAYFPSEPGGDELAAKESGASNVRPNVLQRQSESVGAGYRLRVNYGFLAQLMTEGQGTASDRKIVSASAVHRQAFIAYQSAQGILDLDVPSGRDMVQGRAANRSVGVVGAGKVSSLDLIA